MKPYILITNDDGVYSSGLKALAEALNDLADIIIVGPNGKLKRDCFYENQPCKSKMYYTDKNGHVQY